MLLCLGSVCYFLLIQVRCWLVTWRLLLVVLCVFCFNVVCIVCVYGYLFCLRIVFLFAGYDILLYVVVCYFYYLTWCLIVC